MKKSSKLTLLVETVLKAFAVVNQNENRDNIIERVTKASEIKRDEEKDRNLMLIPSKEYHKIKYLSYGFRKLAKQHQKINYKLLEGVNGFDTIVKGKTTNKTKKTASKAVNNIVESIQALSKEDRELFLKALTK